MVPLESGIRVAAMSVESKQTMMVHHEAMKIIVGALQKFELNWLVVNTRKLVACTCVVLLVVYCRDIPEGNGMSAVQYGVAVKKSCGKYTATGNDVIRGWIAGERSLRDIKTVRRSRLEIFRKRTVIFGYDNELSEEKERQRRQKLVNIYSVSSWLSLLETFTCSRGVKAGSVYSVFTFERLHKIHRRLFQLLK